MKALITTFLIATCGAFTAAYGQNDAKTPAVPASAPSAAATTTCPSPTEVNQLHLYGLWQATWADTPAPAELRLERHPELAESVRGTLRRGGQVAQVAGDVDDGDFTLEESDNGRNISATWTGRVVDTSCGKEIRGTWTNANNTRNTSFVLRKQPGWR